MFRKFFSLAILFTILILMTSNASAISKSKAGTIPHTDVVVEANVYHNNTWIKFQTNKWVTSSKAFRDGSAFNVSQIRNRATVHATGIGVSFAGVSGGSASGNLISAQWTNWNAWISDLHGSYGYNLLSIVPLYVTTTSEVFAIFNGAKSPIIQVSVLTMF